MNQESANFTTLSQDAGFTRLPYSMLKLSTDGGRRMRGRAADILGLIHSFSSAEENPDASCKLSYSGFQKILNVSHATVARQLKKAFENGLITKDTSNPFHNTYTFAGTLPKKPYITIEHYLYYMRFDFRDGKPPRTLTDSERKILCHIKTHCDNEEGDGTCRGSERGFAAALGISKNTAQKGLANLIKARLIYYAARGKNNYQRSAYKYTQRRLRASQKAYKKMSNAAKRDAGTDERIERERFYTARQEQESARVNRIRAILNADPIYAKLEAEHRPLGKSIAFAELYNPGDVAALKRRETDLAARMSARMAALGVSEADLKPRYHCAKCNDTGFTVKDGRLCDCYPGRPSP